MRIIAVSSILIHFLFLSHLWPQSSPQIDRKTFEIAYTKGKTLFYETLKQKAINSQLYSKDQKMLIAAEKKIPGLYEHLMNFYYFLEKKDKTDKENFCSGFLVISRNMAEEFIESIPKRGLKKRMSPLKSLLFSTGYFSRKCSPQYRSFLRLMANRVKGQWALEELNVRKAHPYTKGKGIKLAIVDSGVDPTIKEIKAQLAKWKNFLDGSKPIWDKGKFPYDWGGHGTSIASIIYQIAPEVEIMVVKVHDQETMSTVPPSKWSIDLIAAGIYWAVQNGADIISLSVALGRQFIQLWEASKFCWEQNIVLITPMGNAMEEKYENIPYFPAAYPWTIAVGGVEKKEGILKDWKFSAKGNYIDVVAPASGIWVEMPSYLDKRQRPKAIQGNSFAAPLVAGTTALILSTMNETTLKKLKEKPGQLVEAVRKILRKTASNKKLGYNGPNSSSGYGLIDVQMAVKQAKALNADG